MGLDRALRRAVTHATLIASMVLSRPLAAKPDQDSLAVARELFLEAMQLEEARDYPRALATLRRVAAIKLSPSVRAHLAFCLERTGKLAEALTIYEALASEDSGGADAATKATAVRASADLRARVPRLTIRVVDRAPELRVLLDDAPLAMGLYGEPLLVDPGPHRIQATAAGRQPIEATVTLEERAVAVYEVRFATDHDAHAPPASTRPVRLTARAEPLRTSPGPQPGSRSRALPIAMTASSITLLAGGVVAFSVAGSKQRAAREACLTRIDCEDLRTAPRTWDAVALSALGGAVIAGGLSAYLWTRPASARAVSVTAGAGTVGVRGDF